MSGLPTGGRYTGEVNRRVDFIASQPHYADHLDPVHAGLGIAGTFYLGKEKLIGPTPDLVVVASYLDLTRARRFCPRVVFMEHGCGLSYKGTWNASYSGSPDRSGVVKFLLPNNYAAARVAISHPHIPRAVIGCPKLDEWHRRTSRRPSGMRTLGVSFHWDCRVVPETRSALPHFRSGLNKLVGAGYRVLGHGHPWVFRQLEPLWKNLGVEPVADFQRILEEADVYAVDNSSTLYEFASTDRPVVVMNAPWYRRDVHHGLRFWEHSDVGVNVDSPDDMISAVSLAFEDTEDQQRRRRIATDAAYPVRGCATAAAIREIEELL